MNNPLSTIYNSLFTLSKFSRDGIKSFFSSSKTTMDLLIFSPEIFSSKKELLMLFKTICTHTWPEYPVYTEGVYASSPRPAERERNMGLSRGDGKHGTCGPPERRPVERKRSRPGGALILWNIKTPESICSTLGFADPSLWYFVLHRCDFIVKDFQCQRLVHLFFLTSIPSSPIVVLLVWNPLTVSFAPLHIVSSRRNAYMIQIPT